MLLTKFVALLAQSVPIWQKLGENGDIKPLLSRLLNDCEAEAAETQVWLKFAVKCQYLTVEQGRELYGTYNQVQVWVSQNDYPSRRLVARLTPHTSHTSHTPHTPPLS